MKQNLQNEALRYNVQRLSIEILVIAWNCWILCYRKTQIPRHHEKTRSKNCTFQPVIIDPDKSPHVWISIWSLAWLQ